MPSFRHWRLALNEAWLKNIPRQRHAGMTRISGRSCSGFTMIELIAVLVIMTILGAVAISRLSNNDTAVIGQVAVVKSHIHFAQMMAMKSNVSWGILSSSTSYTLKKNGATSTVFFPSEGSPTHSLPSGITVTFSTNPLMFDQWGSPGTSDVTVTITNGATSITITVSRNTGLVS